MSEDKKGFSKSPTSVIGVIAIIGLLAVGGFWSINEAMKRDNENKRTQQSLEEIADEFTSSDPDVLKDWAQGEVKDLWGTKIKVEQGKTENHIVVRSAGPDLLYNTEDDVLCERKIGIFSKIKGVLGY